MSDEELQRQAYEGLDHKFFDDVIVGLVQLRTKVQEQRFEVRGASGSDEEWTQLQKIKKTIEALKKSNNRFEMFEPYERLRKIQGIEEELNRILRGTH